MNTDTGLFIGAAASITIFGLCFVGSCIRSYCMKPRIKESRSDNDLTQLAGSEDV